MDRNFCFRFGYLHILPRVKLLLSDRQSKIRYFYLGHSKCHFSARIFRFSVNCGKSAAHTNLYMYIFN